MAKPQNINYNNEGSSIDVTQEVQHALMNYFSVFGTKMIDFNPDISAFKKLEHLIGKQQAETLIAATSG